MQKRLKKLLLLSVSMALLAVCISACSKAKAAEQPKPEVKYVEVADRTEYVHMICDLDLPPILLSNGETELDVVLPNGEIHVFYMDDVPEGVSEVVIKSSDIDDYSTYEIVGMR